MQMTIRNITQPMRAKLEDRARAEGKSLNEVAVNAMAEGLGMGRLTGKPQRDLSFMVGTEAEAEALDKASDECREVDLESWK